MKGAKERIVVAGGHGKENDLIQLSEPRGLAVNPFGIVYMVHSDNHRIMRFGSKKLHKGILSLVAIRKENKHINSTVPMVYYLIDKEK